MTSRDQVNPAELRIAEQGGALTWSLASSYAGGDVTGGGRVEVSGTTVRLVGTLRQPIAGPHPSAPMPPRVDVVYSATLSGDTFEGAGTASDNRVHQLSVKRAAP